MVSDKIIHTSSIDSIVDSAKLLDSALHKVVDLLCARDIGLDGEDFGFACADGFFDEFLGPLESFLVPVAECELGATFAGERYGCCLADAFERCLSA